MSNAFLRKIVPGKSATANPGMPAWEKSQSRSPVQNASVSDFSVYATNLMWQSERNSTAILPLIQGERRM
jgi:hypothetical protein